MPELPEVQTIIDDLNKKIKGDTIVSFWSEWPKAIKPASSADEFSKKIQGRKILGARRIGKNIFIDLSGGKTLYIHLKMTGHLLVKKKEEGRKKKDEVNYFSDRVNQYIRHKFYLTDAKLRNKHESTNKYDKVMEFSDVRKFGKIVLDSTKKINELKEIRALGVDAMSPTFTLQKFGQIIERYPRRPIGILIMDQAVIAGVGNIYRSEALFEAGILPTRLSGELKPAEIKKLHNEIIKVLKKAIKLRGTSDSDYRDTSGAPGGFQKVLKVYRKEKKKCPKCGENISREVLAQRAVFFCRKCQK